MQGKIGRVTGKVGPGLVGEVMLPVRGGVEAFNAFSERGEVIEKATRIVVTAFDAPRDVYVTPVLP